MDENQTLLLKNIIPEISELQIFQFQKLIELSKSWNQKINLISRNDIDKIFEHHILHSLSLIFYFQFTENNTIIDVGTGGGFPGIPLSLIFTNTKFTLVDSTQKKNQCYKKYLRRNGYKKYNYNLR